MNKITATFTFNNNLLHQAVSCYYFDNLHLNLRLIRMSVYNSAAL